LSLASAGEADPRHQAARAATASKQTVDFANVLNMSASPFQLTQSLNECLSKADLKSVYHLLSMRSCLRSA
jgi:hypothetical protein